MEAQVLVAALPLAFLWVEFLEEAASTLVESFEAAEADSESVQNVRIHSLAISNKLP